MSRTPIDDQLQDLLSLKDGWLNGEGTAYSVEDITWAKVMLRKFYLDILPIPYIYPTVTNGILMEWNVEYKEKEYSASFEIFFNTHIGYWHCSLLTHRYFYEEQFFNMDEDKSWEQLNNKIQFYCRGK